MSAPDEALAEADRRRTAELDAALSGTAVRFRREFSSALARADDVWQFDVERIAEVYAGDFGTSVCPFLQEMTRWCERVTGAIRRNRSGLRIVQADTTLTGRTAP